MRGGIFLSGLSVVLAAHGAVTARADIISHIPTNDKVVALTFDACEASERVSFDHGILDYLLAREIPFTVFASGKFVEDNAVEVTELSKLDFVDIENHSWNHPNFMNHFSREAVVEEVRRAEESIVAATGRAPQFFRFPAGNYDESGLKAVEELGYTVVHWRWASGDPDRREGANALFRRATSKVEPGDILIFHINGRGVHTAEALPRIVDELQTRGYRFVLVSDYIGRPHPKAVAVPFAAASMIGRELNELLTRAPLLALPQAVD